MICSQVSIIIEEVHDDDGCVRMECCVRQELEVPIGHWDSICQYIIIQVRQVLFSIVMNIFPELFIAFFINIDILVENRKRSC